MPVPVTVNEPLTLFSFMPIAPPSDETLVSDITSGVVPLARVISTAVAPVLLIVPLVVVIVLLLSVASKPR